MNHWNISGLFVGAFFVFPVFSFQPTQQIYTSAVLVDKIHQLGSPADLMGDLVLRSKKTNQLDQDLSKFDQWQNARQHCLREIQQHEVGIDCSKVVQLTRALWPKLTRIAETDLAAIEKLALRKCHQNAQSTQSQSDIKFWLESKFLPESCKQALRRRLEKLIYVQ